MSPRRVVEILITILLIGAADLIVVGLWGGSGRIATAAGPGFDTSEWKTNFKKFSLPLGEIQSGGPPKDGIPAIDRPKFETVAEAGKWLKPLEPVIFLERPGDARAYPLQILIWHEIVNDTVGGTPVTVTFCPLCNTSMVYDRRLNGRVHDFGTTGKLHRSALIMYDRQTESWWWQVSGEAIVGDQIGKRLTVLPSQIVSFATFGEVHPRGRVLARNTGFRRSYGQNPYQGYDDINSSPFLYSGPRDSRLRPMERVATVSIQNKDAAYPFSILAKLGVLNDTVGGLPIVVFHKHGVASALDRADIASSRDIGAVAVFLRVVQGKTLTFRVNRAQFVDEWTQSTWNILGTAVTGRLAGRRLEPIVHGNHFWFAWAAYKPKTRVYLP